MRFSNLFFAMMVLFACAACRQPGKLPIYGPRDVAPGQTDTVYKTIPPFSFLNQDSVPLTQDAFKGKVYVADFFFTSCSSICPVMHRNMKTLYDAYKGNPDVLFLSHTIDEKYDKPSRLKKYAQKLGVDEKQWQFVWGPKKDVYSIAEKDYLVAVQEDSTARDGFVHQGWLVLIDPDKRIRGAYDGTLPEQTGKLKKDIATLLAEYKK
ncbi:SCO family protein [Pedobacter yulinensis]|uniref:SCO family protein n=1 Tax=Pedobacter yulinensis TaxID=2126353 RepID=A0A2T3HKC3_9SPHI|nr:SCO family protein [Pedobacter yulinensis]PST82908.1 SCO family protein [Pedobacter yulinensis]